MDFFRTRLWQWHCQHIGLTYGDRQVAQGDVLNLVVDSIASGEITALDGIDSPISKRIKELHGDSRPFEMHGPWILSPQDWQCPCCGRNKVQISRIGEQGQILAKLVVHHDHMRDAFKEEFTEAFIAAGTTTAQVSGLQLVERISDAFAAHDDILVCEDCNNADAKVKRELGIPKHFSFTVSQIRKFITASDHRSHQLHLHLAQEVWEAAKPVFELRMRLVREVTSAAVTNSHWYEPFPRDQLPIPTHEYSNRTENNIVRQWVGYDELIKALGPKEKIYKSDWTQWRRKSAPRFKALPKDYLAILQSDPNEANHWESVNEHWSCPVCRRSKAETAYVHERGKILFRTTTNKAVVPWVNAPMICNHCAAVRMSLKREIASHFSLSDSQSFVAPEEITEIIIPRPNSSHAIRKVEAEKLVRRILDRLAV